MHFRGSLLFVISTNISDSILAVFRQPTSLLSQTRRQSNQIARQVNKMTVMRSVVRGRLGNRRDSTTASPSGDVFGLIYPDDAVVPRTNYYNQLRRYREWVRKNRIFFRRPPPWSVLSLAGRPLSHESVLSLHVRPFIACEEKQNITSYRLVAIRYCRIVSMLTCVPASQYSCPFVYLCWSELFKSVCWFLLLLSNLRFLAFARHRNRRVCALFYPTRHVRLLRAYYD